MPNFQYYSGTITNITNTWTENYSDSGCNKMITIVGENDNVTNFIVSPSTYFVNHSMVSIGDSVTGVYDGNAPVPLIYPPQFRALVMFQLSELQTVKVDHFNRQLISSDGTLKLNIAPETQLLLTNGQRFTENLGNRNLIVVYTNTTRSIPAQTTPRQVVVLCPLQS